MSDVWYLAGPMSGLPNFNYDAFEAATQALRKAGYTVISPHEINANIHDLSQPETTDQRAFYLRRALRGLLDCTGVVVLPGWLYSRGAQLEVSIAEALNMPVVPVAELL